MKPVKSLSQHASLPLVLMHALLIASLVVSMAMAVPA